jgi:hypothetical protein
MFLCSLSYGQSKVGTTVANFLQIGAGARGVAVGEAATASTRDISGLYWNPALLAYGSENQVYFNHIQWFADIDLNYGSALLSFAGLGNFAATFYTLSADQIEVTTEEYPNGTGDLYTVQDLMAALSYARALTERFNIGASLKYIHSQIWNNTASAIAVDVGLTYRTPYDAVTLGMSISNFGSEMQMRGTDNSVRFDPDYRVGGNNDGIIAEQRTRSWDLPILFRFGLAYDMLRTESHQILVMSDVLYPSSNENYVNVGLEYGFMGSYFLRAGYRQLLLADREGGLTLGAGVEMYRIRVDYAYSDRGVLNDVQYFSIGVRF